MKWIAAILAGLCLVTTVTAVRHFREPRPAPPTPFRFVLPTPDGSEAGAGDAPLDAALSPDGRTVVFVATEAGTPRLWRLRLADERPEPIAGTDGAAMPAFKPTGQVVSFFAQGRLRGVSLADGSVRDLAAAPAPAGATWDVDGSIIFVPDARGPIVRLRGGQLTTVRELASGEIEHAAPQVTEHGLLFVTVRADGRRAVRLAAPSRDVELTFTSGHAELLSGYLLHVRDGVLRAEPFERDAMRLRSSASVILATNVGVSAGGRASFVASEPVLLYAPPRTQPHRLLAFDPDGAQPKPVGDPADYWQVRPAPDGRSLAVTMADRLLGTLDVFVLPADGSSLPRRVSAAIAADTSPVWRGAKRLVFRSLQGGAPDLVMRDLDGGGDRFVLRSPLDEHPTDARGDSILYHAHTASTGQDVFELNADSGVTRAVITGPFSERDARRAPAGDLVAYVSDESGAPNIYIDRWPQLGRRVRVTLAGGTRPAWSADGAMLLFARGDTIYAVEIGPRDGAIVISTPRGIRTVQGLRDFAVVGGRLIAIAADDSVRQVEPKALVGWRGLLGSQ